MHNFDGNEVGIGISRRRACISRQKHWRRIETIARVAVVGILSGMPRRPDALIINAIEERAGEIPLHIKDSR